MAENLSKKPAKSILKNPSNNIQEESNKNVPTDIKWDEMNILQTLHPADKDYGHMKIEEPKTPYSYYSEGTEVSEHGDDVLDANLLAEKITLSSEETPKAMKEVEEDDDDDDDYEDETEEEKEQRKAFEAKRKIHYDEYYAVKLARKLMAKDEDEDEEDKDEDEENKKDENGRSAEEDVQM